jgi:alkyl hydroperoxide reductase subunit AhpC
MLFSHPKDFTPVCSTELGAVAKLKPEFDRAKDIEETQGAALNYPLLGDHDLNVAKLYAMLPAEAVPGKRTPADNATVRSVFIIGPDKKIKLMLKLSDDHRAQLRRGAARDRLAAAHREAQDRNGRKRRSGSSR